MRIALLLYPLLELWSLIELGAQTSAGLAVLWVLGAAFLGMTTIRLAGSQVLSRLQAAQREGVLQQQLVASDMALAIAGLLLIIPGLLSDAMAVHCLLPDLFDHQPARARPISRPPCPGSPTPCTTRKTIPNRCFPQ